MGPEWNLIGSMSLSKWWKTFLQAAFTMECYCSESFDIVPTYPFISIHLLPLLHFLIEFQTSSFPDNHCTVRAPVFSRIQNSALQSIMETPMKMYQSGWMICKYIVCCWPITSSNISIVDQNSVKGGLKSIDCIDLSAEYWCPNGTQKFQKTWLENAPRSCVKSDCSIIFWYSRF